MRHRLVLGLVSCLALLALPLGSAVQAQEHHATSERSIVETAVAAGSFETLVAAVKAAGLAPTLAGDGAFTVFAPTDEAFAALPEGTVATLLRPENKQQLVDILKYHVIPGRVTSEGVSKVTAARTLLGKTVAVKADHSGVRIDNARVIKADILCSNGVIHVIDRVLLPKSKAKAAKHSGSAMRFPATQGENLSRKQYNLPADFEGRKNLVIVAYQRYHQAVVDTWFPAAEAMEADMPDVRFYEIPVLGNYGQSMRTWIDNGMRRGVPKNNHARTITLYLDKAAFNKALDIPNERDIHVLLLDEQGEVIWRESGRFTQAKGAALRKALGDEKAQGRTMMPTRERRTMRADRDDRMMPSNRARTVVDIASGAGQFKTLIAAAKAAGLVPTLTSRGPITVLAPTDAAFAKLPAGTVQKLLRPQNRNLLRQILTYHVIPGRVRAADLPADGSTRTAAGSSLRIRTSNGIVRFNGAKVTKADLMADNGVVHVIDDVLVPIQTAGRFGQDLLARAVEKGAPMYNHGDPAGCARVYAAALNAVVEVSTDLSLGAELRIRRGLARAERTGNARDRAWFLRDTIDDVVGTGGGH